MKGFWIICLLGFIIYGTYYIAMNDKKLLGPKIVHIVNVVKEKIGYEVPKEQDLHCALKSPSLESGAHFKGGLNFSILVDNTDTTCDPWVVFEGQAGTVELYNEYDALLDRGVLTTTSDWTTGFPATYTTSLPNFMYTGKVKLVLIEANPSGEGTRKQSYITLFSEQ